MSKAIDDLVHEHEAILSSLQILDAMVGRLGQNSPPTAEDLRSFIGFLKEFADKCHHGKEEGILFPALVEAGIPEKGGPIGQMLAEHAEGRKLIKGMEAAIAGAVDAIFDRFEEHEEKVIGHGRHEELHAMLKELKRKFAAAAS